MSNGFEDAVAGVQQQPTKNEEVAETFYEKKEYPLVPQGVYKAMIVKSELRESKSKFDDPGTTKINLRYEIISDMNGKPVEYKGDDGEMHKYQVFGKPLAKNYGDGIKTGKPSNLFKLIRELTGIPPLTDEEDAVRTLDNGKTIRGKVIRFNHKMLEYMKLQLIVKHKEYEGKMYAYIDSFMVDSVMQKENYDMLPPHPKKFARGVGVSGRRLGDGGRVLAPEVPVSAEEFRPEKGARMEDAPMTMKDGVDFKIAGRTYPAQETQITEPPPLRTPEQEAMLGKEMESRGFPL